MRHIWQINILMVIEGWLWRQETGLTETEKEFGER